METSTSLRAVASSEQNSQDGSPTWSDALWSIADEAEHSKVVQRIRRGLDCLKPEQIQSQHQSILFKLPSELRLMVYKFALQQHHYTMTRNLGPNSQLHQPLFRQRRSLLATCRRIFLEARYFGLENHTFVYPLNYDSLLWKNMRNNALSSVSHLILLPGMFEVSNELDYLRKRHPYFRPRYITVRMANRNVPSYRLLDIYTGWIHVVSKWCTDALILEVLSERRFVFFDFYNIENLCMYLQAQG
jgi:hypothetical protein